MFASLLFEQEEDIFIIEWLVLNSAREVFLSS